MARGRGGGRIRPNERETNDNAAILGANLEIQVEHSQGVRDMEQRGLDLTTKRNYRNRIKEIYTFFAKNYSEYHSVGVRELSEEDQTDPDSYFWKNTHDLIYTGINVRMVKAFLAHNKKHQVNGKTSSHVQLHKYSDAITAVNWLSCSNGMAKICDCTSAPTTPTPILIFAKGVQQK